MQSKSKGKGEPYIRSYTLNKMDKYEANRANPDGKELNERGELQLTEGNLKEAYRENCLVFIVMPILLFVWLKYVYNIEMW